MIVFLLFLVVVPFLVAGVLHTTASALPPFIAYMRDRGSGWGAVAFLFPVLFAAWIIRRPFPPGDLDETTPMRQIATVMGWWWLGAIPALALYAIWAI